MGWARSSSPLPWGGPCMGSSGLVGCQVSAMTVDVLVLQTFYCCPWNGWCWVSATHHTVSSVFCNKYF